MAARKKPAKKPSARKPKAKTRPPRGKGDPAARRFKPNRTRDMFGETVERVVAVRAPSRKAGKNADDQAVVLKYRRYSSGKRSKGSITVIDADEAHGKFKT